MSIFRTDKSHRVSVKFRSQKLYFFNFQSLENCSNRNLPTLSNKVTGGRVARKAQWPFIVNFGKFIFLTVMRAPQTFDDISFFVPVK